jgi:hypothetical protein
MDFFLILSGKGYHNYKIHEFETKITKMMNKKKYSKKVSKGGNIC